jgi:hypothetical protein
MARTKEGLTKRFCILKSLCNEKPMPTGGALRAGERRDAAFRSGQKTRGFHP